MGIDTAAKKIQINKLVRSQVPSFVAEDNPLFVDFLKQYYISGESKGKSIDLITNFNDYQKAETYSETYNLIGTYTIRSTQAIHKFILQIDNIFDRKYYNHLSRIKSIMPEKGRNIGFQYRLNF